MSEWLPPVSAYSYRISHHRAWRFGRERILYTAEFYHGPFIVGEGCMSSYNAERLSRRADRGLRRLEKGDE